MAQNEEEATAVEQFRRWLPRKWREWQRSRPLAQSFFTRFQGRAKEGVRLARLIQHLEVVPGLGEVLRDIGSPRWQDYTHGVMIAEVATGLLRRGCEVRFPERTKERTPDAGIHLVTREVIVEFKSLHESDENERWFALLERISRARGLATFSGELDLDFEANALRDLKGVLDGLRVVYERQAHDWVPLPRGTGHARLAALGNTGHIRWPGRSLPDIARACRELWAWSAQLKAQQGPTLLIVRSCRLYDPLIGLDRSAAAAILADEVASALPAVPHVSAMLLYEEAFAQPPSPGRTAAEGYLAAWDSSAAGMAQARLFVRNDVAAVPLRADECKTVMSARW